MPDKVKMKSIVKVYSSFVSPNIIFVIKDLKLSRRWLLITSSRDSSQIRILNSKISATKNSVAIIMERRRTKRQFFFVCYLTTAMYYSFDQRPSPSVDGWYRVWMIYGHVITVDECGPYFLTFVLRLMENAGKKLNQEIDPTENRTPGPLSEK